MQQLMQSLVKYNIFSRYRSQIILLNTTFTIRCDRFK